MKRDCCTAYRDDWHFWISVDILGSCQVSCSENRRTDLGAEVNI